MRPLNHKLLRDLVTHRSQYLAIALVIAIGIAAQVATGGLLVSVGTARDDFYAAGRFADLFAAVKRAPDSEIPRLSALPGVRAVSTRVTTRALVIDPRFTDTPSLQLLSWSDTLDAVLLQSGRPPRADATEVVLASAFATANGLAPGDRVTVVARGRRTELRIVGVGDSPEFVYSIGPGEMLPDYRRHGVAWMANERLAAITGLSGAFNTMSVALAPGASAPAVVERLDAALARYGGLGAYGRDEQMSHRFIQNELDELRIHATVVPMIFLAAAAFLLHMVITRRVQRERELIGMLKSFGYDNAEIALHYLMLGMAIFALGALLGLLLGIWLGQLLAGVYLDFFRLPDLGFRMDPGRTMLGILVAAAAVATGTFAGLRAVVRLPPAEAMRPPAPPDYRATRITGRLRWLGLPERLVVRHLARTPLRTLLTLTGLATACALVTFSGFQSDAIDFMTSHQFDRQDRSDLSVTFHEPRPGRAVQELMHRRGVRLAEPFRSVPVRLQHGHAHYRTVIEGRPGDGRLARLLDREGRSVNLPTEGLLLSAQLGDMLGLQAGDELEVQLLETTRARYRVRVAALVDDFVGVGAWIELDALHRLLGEQDAVDGVRLAVDPALRGDLQAQLVRLPAVAAVARRQAQLDSFQETFGQSLLIVALVFLVIAGLLAFGMVFNFARTLLDERRRELATLRVLGQTRVETAYVLVAELTLLTLLAVLPGLALGHGLAALVAGAMRSELFRLPVVLSTDSQARAVLVLVAAAAVSAAWSVRDLGRLDIRESLNARD